MKLNNIEELRVLSAIVEGGSLTAASDRLGLPARTIGRRLAALESRLGQTLVHRTTRSLEPTVGALRFIERCREALDLLSHAEDLLGDERAELSGVVRASVPTLFAEDVVAMAKGALAQFPQLTVELEVRDALITDLREQSLDLAVVMSRPSRGPDKIQRVGEIRSCLAATPAYLAERGTPQRPEDLQEHDCLRFTRQEVWTLRRGNQRVDVPVKGGFVSNDSRALRHAMLAGLGIGLASKKLVADLGPSLGAILPQWHWPPLTVWMLTESRSADLRRVQVVREALRAAAKRTYLTR